jgi:hypothetical protein
MAHNPAEHASLPRTARDRKLLITGEDTRIVVAGRAASSDGKIEASGRTISLDADTAELLGVHLALLDCERAELGDAYQDDGRLFSL